MPCTPAGNPTLIISINSADISAIILSYLSDCLAPLKSLNKFLIVAFIKNSDLNSSIILASAFTSSVTLLINCSYFELLVPEFNISLKLLS